MKRRRFVQALVALPAPALLAQQTAETTPSSTLAIAPNAGAQVAAQDALKLQPALPDNVAEPDARFFNAQQFAALRRLSDLLMPPMRGNPGALEAKAPEFLN